MLLPVLMGFQYGYFSRARTGSPACLAKRHRYAVQMEERGRANSFSQLRCHMSCSLPLSSSDWSNGWGGAGGMPFTVGVFMCLTEVSCHVYLNQRGLRSRCRLDGLSDL